MRRMNHKRRGSILLLAIFFLMVTFFLAMALLELLPLEMRAAGRHRMETAAFLAADSGVLHALSFLEKRNSGGETPLPGNAASHTLEGRAGSWTWKATLKADPETPPNGTNLVRVYEIRSVASLDGIPYRAIQALARQESFARYAWFEDRRDSNLSIPAGSWRFDGPFHCNDRIRLTIPNNFYTTDHPPTFEGEVTTAESYATNDGVDYNGNNPWDSKGNPLPERYQKIYRGGRESLLTGAKRIELPSDTSALCQSALGRSATLPGTPGVYLTGEVSSEESGGGITIVGNVDAMTLAVEEGGNRSVTIRQGSATTRVIEVTDTPTTDPDGNPVPVGSTLILKPDDSFQVRPDLTNGLVYCTQNIKGLQGVNKGRRTIAVDLGAGKEIVLGGSLTRADTPVGEEPAGNRDTLGLVAYNVQLPTTIAKAGGPPVDIYAAILAGSKGSDGGFQVQEWQTRAPGRLRIYGGLMVARKQSWGYSDGHGGVSTGIEHETHYDPHLASSPPPYFPTIGKFRVVRYQEEAPDQG